MKDRLVEIPVADWPKLRDLYKSRKFESASYNLIQNYIDWLEKDPSIDFAKFYSLNGDWSDGTFILQDSYLILFDTLVKPDNASRLYKALCLLNYSGLRVFNGYDSRLQSVVEKVVEELNLNGSDKLNGSYDLYVLRQQVAVEISQRSPPEGITISPLNENHALAIDKIWVFRHEGSLNATKKLIKYGRSQGAFTDDGRLIAWVIVQQTGALGLLKVSDNFRRLGIASLLVSRLSKEIAATGQDVMTLISPDNQENQSEIMLNTRNDCQDRLFTAINCLNPKSRHFFCGFPDRVKPTIERYFSQLNLKIDPSKIGITIWQHISPEEALKFNTEPPEGITLSALRQEDVDTINSIWPHRHPGSEKFISRLIALNLNVGAYDRDGNLLSWCLRLPIGSLGVLHVQDGHKRKGYGNLLVRVMSKKLAEMGIEITAPVIDTNVASRAMFKKLGFQEIDKVYWLDKPALE